MGATYYRGKDGSASYFIRLIHTILPSQATLPRLREGLRYGSAYLR